MADIIEEVGDWTLRLQRDGRWLLTCSAEVVDCGGEALVSWYQFTGRTVAEVWSACMWSLPDHELVPIRAALHRAALVADAEARLRQKRHSARLRRAIAARKLADAMAVERLEAEAGLRSAVQ